MQPSNNQPQQVYYSPNQPVQPPPQHQPSKPSPKKVPVVLGTLTAFIVLVIVIIVLVLISGGGKKTIVPANQTNTTQAQLLQPAQAIELEQTNNALSQDLSGLNDEKDFSTTSLDDKMLGL